MSMDLVTAAPEESSGDQRLAILLAMAMCSWSTRH